MLFLLMGLAVLAASVASWAFLLADVAFSNAIMRDGIMTFWWNSISILLSEPKWLTTTPSIAVPLLAATVGPLIGLPVAAAGAVTLWRRPKEIEVQGRATKSEPVFRPAETRPSVRSAPASMLRPIGERKEADVAAVFRPSLVGEGKRKKKAEEKDSVVAAARSHQGEGFERGGKVGRIVFRIGDALSGLLADLRARSSAARERSRTEKAVAVEHCQAAARAPVDSAAQEAASQDMKDLQPLPERIMAWYAAWMTVRAGQRPPRMLEEARRLAKELTPETRAEMTGYGMRGATALSMLESAATAGMARGTEEEEDDVPPLKQEERVAAAPASVMSSDIEEFMREVEAPSPYERPEQASVQSPQATDEPNEGPILIEDDIAAPASIAPKRKSAGRSEDWGPVVVEDDINMPSVDRPAVSRKEDPAARRMVGDVGREEVATGIEESEFLPVPGTVEPLSSDSAVVTTTTTGWDEVVVGETSVETTPFGGSANDKNVDRGEFLAKTAAARAESQIPEPKRPAAGEADGSKEKNREDRQAFGKAVPEMSATVEDPEPIAVGHDGWPTTETTEAVPKPVVDRQVSADGAAPVEKGSGLPGDSPAGRVAAEEEAAYAPRPEPTDEVAAAEHETPDATESVQAFPSGIGAEAQEAVIGRLLADPVRRATILGEREGSPAWMLRRLELHGLLGLSDKTNPAVVRMWEALDRLVAYQARVFAWESLKETPPAAFATPEQRAAHVVDLAREVICERERVGASLLEEIRRIKAGTEHVAWMDGRVDNLLAAMTSAKVVAQLSEFLPRPVEEKAEAGGRLLKVMTGLKETEADALVETPYEDLLAASHDIHQRYKEICKELMVPIYRSLSVKVKEEDGRPAYAQVELVIGDVATTRQRGAASEGAVGIIFAKVPAGQWRIAEANGRAKQDRLVLEGMGENAGRLVRLRDRSLDVFRRWVEARNMRAFCVIHLLCEEGAVVDGIDRRWDGVEFVRNPWGQKDMEAIKRKRLKPGVE
jgi:hypothetical protein